ncbi:DUF4030 domain-containing protein [Peribacillus frigoritolerans]|uniref:DUF4030 domain-containing protein n=1 Tax=Peribacillus frigoritolerans TaxID=450367 RepID=UPI002B24F05D|nr:DUF4030 domain-containing protein [Peribacillus frigoritolerans]MEB2494441.1 DUF4030 domain-containing protein [Peribacillus frigoritolerans]
MKEPFEDTDFDASLKKLNSDLMWKTKQKQDLKKRIITDIEKLEFKEKNKNPILSTRIKKVSLIRKLAYSSIALIILFGLFISSTFVSPAMAEVVSKIPFLSSIINKKSISDIISEELKEYNIDGSTITFTTKEIYITVGGTEQYYKSVKDEIEGIVKDILQSQNYDAYKIKVDRYKDMGEDVPKKQIEEIEKWKKKDKEVLKALDNVKKKYNPLQLSVVSGSDFSKRTVEIEIPDTEPKSTEAIKKEVTKIIQTTTREQLPVKIKKIDMEKLDQDKRWRMILDSITEELIGKKDYKITLTGYSINSEPRIDIWVSLKSSDPDSRVHGEQIEQVLKEYLNSKEMKKMVKNDFYKINIYSKDKKKIN